MNKGREIADDESRTLILSQPYYKKIAQHTHCQVYLLQFFYLKLLFEGLVVHGPWNSDEESMHLVLIPRIAYVAFAARVCQDDLPPHYNHQL